MKKTLTFIFLATAFFASAQEYVNDTFEKGYIKDGQRFRIWEFYNDDKELELKIDFSNGKIYYLKPSETEFVVQKEYDWVKIKPQVYPIYALGSHNFYKEVRQRLKLPTISRSGKSSSGRASVMFTVDSLGKAGDFQLIEKFGSGTDRNIMEAMKAIPNLWIPAIHNKKRINARFILPIVYLSSDETVPEKPYSQQATILKPLVISVTSEVVNPVVASLRYKPGPGYVVKEHGNFVEEYEADDKTKIKNGIYQRYTLREKLVSMLEKGTYKNDKKDGLWTEYMTSKKLALFRGGSNISRASGKYESDVKHGPWEEYHMLNWKREIRFLTDGDVEDSTSLFAGPKISKIATRGEYNQGRKSGPWIYFGTSGDTSQVYDYSSHRLLRDLDFANTEAFNQSQTPLYEGGTAKLNDDLYEHFDFSNVLGLVGKDSTYALFLVNVGPDGKTTDVKYLQGTAHNLINTEIIKAWKLVDDWIPAYKDGQPALSSNVYAVSLSRKWRKEKNYEAAAYSIRTWLVNH